VKLGWRSEDKVQVLEGLSEGEKVVTTANFLVDSESRLRAAIEGFVASEQPAPPAAAPAGNGTGHGH
jgi:membrane fusion protein, copper/silver efflux system